MHGSHSARRNQPPGTPLRDHSRNECWRLSASHQRSTPRAGDSEAYDALRVSGGPTACRSGRAATGSRAFGAHLLERERGIRTSLGSVEFAKGLRQATILPARDRSSAFAPANAGGRGGKSGVCTIFLVTNHGRDDVFVRSRQCLFPIHVPPPVPPKKRPRPPGEFPLAASCVDGCRPRTQPYSGMPRSSSSSS
jgi:hypothetical protein